MSDAIPPTARRRRMLFEDPDAVAQELSAPQPDRRRFLQLMAAGLALGGLTGCGGAGPDGHLIPAVIAAPGIVPGKPNRFATANLRSGFADGIVVEHLMGRPIKVEGNPNHPASLGATDIFGQAAVLDFYDPDRSSGVLNADQPTSRQALLTMLVQARLRLAQTHGQGFRILTGPLTSPTLGRAIDAVLAHYPEARWHQWEPISRDTVRAGAVLAYGQPLDLLPHVDRADVLVALDSDLLSSAPGHLRFARDFASRRNPARGPMSRVYAIEPTPTLTGTAADHRIVATPAELHATVLAMADALLRNTAPSNAPPFLAPMVTDLKAARGRALIHAGPDLPAETHALVHAMNEALGARGATLDLIEPAAYRSVDQGADFGALIDDMAAGKIELLLMLDVNPCFASAEFAQALSHVQTSIASSPWLDETGEAATWFVPATHSFETWGDARAYDGSATILQPQALPLYGGTDPVSLLSLLLTGDQSAAPMDAVQATWKDHLAAPSAWHDALASGVVPGSASAIASVALRSEAVRAVPPPPAAQPLTVLFRPDPCLWDGRYANNPWLQECPRPLTKVVWDNPLLIAPDLAQRMALKNGAEVRVAIGTHEQVLPVWIVPGQAAGCAVALLGYGRRVVGHVGNGTGFDTYPLRAAAGAPTLKPTGRHLPIASTEHHNALEDDGHDVARFGTLTAFRATPDFLKGSAGSEEIYRKTPPAPVAWGMSVDLNACIGCNACVVACMAENNVPVVGKEAVLQEREMHWLRIDRYYDSKDAASAHARFQPVLCMHCEEAPCEMVCPVGATVHDSEGLNLMVYNRCVGTRFCSNNCPYKVRRFNYGPYGRNDPRPPAARNPDVTVRGRGVMEKCTFCVQRIAAARIAHDKDGVAEQAETACQAVCPTRAFTFGDLNRPDSAVVQRKQSPLDYVLLPEQNTHPRVTYEAHILNLNPDVAA